MKNRNNKYLVTLVSALIFAISCKTSQSKEYVNIDSKSATANSEKSGAQLWGENCVRCHNAPPPQAYSNEQWAVIGQHMRIRANITQNKIDKIIEFIKSSN